MAKLRPEEDFQAVRRLVGTGIPDHEIARRTGVPRATVARWRVRPYRLRHTVPAPLRYWRPADQWAYCYLLGLYLGDGHLVVVRDRAASLRLCLDARYPLLIQAAKNAMARTAPSASVRTFRKSGCLVVWATDAAWPAAFPQHGPGRKHTRPIRLAAWQRELTERHPKALLRGLIHSDGCRTVNRFTVTLPRGGDREYEYPRYFFSNLSADIREIFCSHCDLLGIHWTRSRYRDISISRRRSVALLDSFIGPKA